MNITDDAKIVLHSGSVASGSDAIEPDGGVDCRGFQGVTFFVAMGAVDPGAEVIISAQVSDDDGVDDDWTSIKTSAMTVTDDSDGKVIVLDVHHPPKAFVRCRVQRAVQDSAVSSILAILYDPSRRATARHATISGLKHLADPALGTP
jgi:hypothetical protein